MTYRLGYNRTRQPVIVDEAGRTVGGLAHGPVDDNSPYAQREAGLGRLTYVDLDDGAAVSADVAELLDRVVELEARRDQLKTLNPSTLRTVADAHGLPAGGTPTQLAGILAAHPDVDPAYVAELEANAAEPAQDDDA